MTEKCIRCGSSDAEERMFGNKWYWLCDGCCNDAIGLIEGLIDRYVHNNSDYFIGFTGKEIPELKELFAKAKNEDIRKLVKFLEGIEYDLRMEE